MKKLLVLALSLTLWMTAVLSVVKAEEEPLSAMLWEPVEITLASTAEYENPYLEAEIDATFTHEDGTVIALPGFWKGADTWAVRFSPTKTGKWTYTVTCTDEKNTGLTASGTIMAKESDKTTGTAQHGFVRVSDDSRHFSYADGTPFLWLGDTNWQAPNYVKTTDCNFPYCTCGNQFRHEVDNRLSKGFTVYQTYFEPAAGGNLWAIPFTMPNTKTFNERIDSMFAYLNEQGMMAAVGFGCHSATLNRIKDVDFFRFVRYCVARYACYNVVWITGQEITVPDPAAATPTRTVMNIYMEAAARVSRLDGYKHPNSAHMYPLGLDDDRAHLLDAASWHTFWELQCGHGAGTYGKAYQFYYYNKYTGNVKPIVEGEANYEEINCGGFTGYDASRYSAWNALLNGCAGFTYGATGIWANCYSTWGDVGWYGATSSYSYEPWYIGLDKPGSYEIGYLRSFLEHLPDWEKMIPAFSDDYYADFRTHRNLIISHTEDMSTVIGYSYEKKTDGPVLHQLHDEEYHALWFNPLTGRYREIGLIKPEDGTYTLPDKPDNGDWAFVLTTEGLKGAYYLENTTADLYAADADNTVTGSPVLPKAVSAVGGCYYGPTGMRDDTANLFDGDPETLWYPTADRTTQTIIADLGTAQELSHVVITPSETSLLPRFRVEGSNDGVLWTEIVNTTFREPHTKDRSYSEKLAGAFRYVKILFLNPEVQNQPDVYRKNGIQFVYNGMDRTYYPHMEISDITIYSLGAAGTVEEITPVTDPLTEKPEKPDGMPLKTVLSLAGAGAAVLLALGAILVCQKRKKKKEQ